MKATDLMVGDWVICNYYSDRQFYMQFGVGDFQKLGFELCDPIPLTPEILEKNGFICDGGSWWYQDFRIVLSTSKGVSLVCGKQKRFDYVHQLQHALRLCGIEKEIEL